MGFGGWGGGVDSSLETYMLCVGPHDIKPPMYEKFIEETNVYVLTIG